MTRLRFMVQKIEPVAVLVDGAAVRRFVVTTVLSPTVVHVDGIAHAFEETDDRVTQRRDGGLFDGALTFVVDDVSAWGPPGAEFFVEVAGIDAPPLPDQIRAKYAPEPRAAARDTLTELLDERKP